MRTLLRPSFWLWALVLWWYAPSVAFFILGGSPAW